MEKLTGQQIIEILNNDDSFDIDEFAYFENETIEGIGVVEEVYQKGGEGEGDHWETVKYFPFHDVYIRLEGWYSSYDGVNFDGYEYEVVRPVEKTITVYE
jgi:hypothetical protein